MYRLLIADDNADSRERTRTLLDWSAYGISTITTAASYVEAVDKAMDLKPHVAMVSIQLGDHMGYELVEHLHSIGLKTIFCMVADSDSRELIRESMRSGARDYLLRPLETKEVQAFLERAVVNQLNGTLPETGTVKNEVDPVLGVEYSTLSKITNKIILVVRGDYRSTLTLAAIADELNMSSKYIGRIFLKDTGMKFSEYLMSYRMLEAKKLIVNTQEKISVIAYMVGYVQLNNFYTHFKNYFGVSPCALRNYESTPESAGSIAY